METPRLEWLLVVMLERMRMYQAGVALANEVQPLLGRAKAEAPRAADHLERSVNSVLFNTAEGIGAFKPRVKIAAYDVARREASEVRATLRMLVIKGVLAAPEVRKADSLACVCIAMLTRAILSLERRPG